MTGRLAGKRALIAGGATGIGAAAALRFVAQGAALVLLDMNAASGTALVEELRTFGATAAYIACDVSDVSAVGVATERAVATLGGLDIVFANAAVGTIVVGGTVETTPPETWVMAFDVNARGVYALMRECVPHLRSAGGGAIVITSSTRAFIGAGSRPTHAYAATKGALHSLVRAMAVSYGPDNIRVNAIARSFVRTRLTEGIFCDPRRLEAARALIPLGRHAEPEEIAACALLLASDDASFVNGSVLVVDGGATVN